MTQNLELRFFTTKVWISNDKVLKHRVNWKPNTHLHYEWKYFGIIHKDFTTSHIRGRARVYILVAKAYSFPYRRLLSSQNDLNFGKIALIPSLKSDLDFNTWLLRANSDQFWVKKSHYLTLVRFIWPLYHAYFFSEIQSVLFIQPGRTFCHFIYPWSVQ